MSRGLLAAINNLSIKTRWTRSLREWLGQIFAFDVRALAIFRFSLGMMLVIDLVCRSGDIIAHYCDDGMLPRKNLLEFSAKSWYVSLHLISGQPIVQTVLFLMAAGFAVLLAIGYRTWLMTFLSWGILLSLHARNPLILNDGDAVLRMLLFWSLFLPLGARWSSDSCSAIAGREPEKQNVATVGTFCYASQISVIYLFAGLLKTGDSWSIGKRWNLLHKDTPLEIETIQLIYMSEPTRRDGSAGEISQKILWRHWFHEKFRSRFYSG